MTIFTYNISSNVPLFLCPFFIKNSFSSANSQNFLLIFAAFLYEFVIKMLKMKQWVKQDEFCVFIFFWTSCFCYWVKLYIMWECINQVRLQNSMLLDSTSRCVFVFLSWKHIFYLTSPTAYSGWVQKNIFLIQFLFPN